MVLYYCKLTLHDNVFFATREMGILYETEKYLHNWALSYAFFSGTYIPQPYRLEGAIAQKPKYLDETAEQSLLHLARKEIYLFPALPLRWSYQINTFKAAQTNYHGQTKKFGDKGANRNYPINFGRAKELATGSEYGTYAIAPENVKIPRWIRLGKWMAKIKVQAVPIPDEAIESRSQKYNCQHPLNPLDLPPAQELLLYDRIVMPPVSLLSQAQLQGNCWKLSGKVWEEFIVQFPELPKEVYLPEGMAYGCRGCRV